MAALLKTEYSGLEPDSPASLPGRSWHQWGEATDLYAVVGYRTIWGGSPSGAIVSHCKEADLVSGTYFQERRRSWHVQLRKEKNPLYVRGLADSWAMIEDEMKKRFNLDLSDDLSEIPPKN